MRGPGASHSMDANGASFEALSYQNRALSPQSGELVVRTNFLKLFRHGSSPTHGDVTSAFMFQWPKAASRLTARFGPQIVRCGCPDGRRSGNSPAKGINV
jgi:hypothetical protein